MKIPPIRYFFQPERWKWFIIAQMKKYLAKNGELNKPLKKYEQFNIAHRVVSAQKCFKEGNCPCNCNIVDVINTNTYKCAEGCFNAGFQNQEQFDQYMKSVDIEFGSITMKMKEHGK